MLASLPGFRAFYPEECARRDHLFKVWAQVARRHGFVAYDAPLLEPTELYTQKSGDEIVGQLFNFTDKGGRDVALRPEMTPSLARLVGARANALKRPVKWYAIVENFRYEKPQKGRLRSHYQLNADLLGEPDVGAEAELIALVLAVFGAFGLGDQVVLRLSDRTLWSLYLESHGLTGDAASAVLGIIDKWEREDREVTTAKLKAHFGDRTERFLAEADELVKLRSVNDLQNFLAARIEAGEVRARLDERLAKWTDLLTRVAAMGLSDAVSVDLGIVRGLAYYTGFVFEVFPRQGQSRALCGGGRYDHLLEKLGFPAMPALGFGLGDVTLTDLLEERNLLPPLVQHPDIYVVIGGEAERLPALAAIRMLREAGYVVEYPLKSFGFGKQFKQAGQSGAPFALIFGHDEVAAGAVRLRDLRGGGEEVVPSASLRLRLEAAFAAGGLQLPEA